MNLTVWKYRFDKQRYVKQINNIWEQQKKVMSEKNHGLRHMERGRWK